MTTDEDLEESIQTRSIINENLWCKERLEIVHVITGEENHHTMSIQHGKIIYDGLAPPVVMFPSVLDFTLDSLRSKSSRVTLKYAGSEFSLTPHSDLCIDGTTFSFQQDRVTFRGTLLDNGEEDTRDTEGLERKARLAMFFQRIGIEEVGIGISCPNLSFRLESVNIELTPGVKNVRKLLKEGKDDLKTLLIMKGLLQIITFKINGEILCEKGLDCGENYLRFLKQNDVADHDTDRQEKLWMIDLKKDSLSLQMNHLNKFTVSIAPLHHFEVSGTRVQFQGEEGRTTFKVGEVIVVGKIYFCTQASREDILDDEDEDAEEEEEIWSVPKLMDNKKYLEEKLSKASLAGEYPFFPTNFKLRVERIFIPNEIVKDRLVSVGI